MQIDYRLRPSGLVRSVERVFALAKKKARALDRAWDASRGGPVFTIRGRYTTRGWTEWTQGFQYGCMILAFDGTGDTSLLELGRRRTLEHMLPHVTHTGVHDHGFNNLSTYGNLRRLVNERRIKADRWERRFYDAAICCSGAVQAARWADTADGGGYVYSFNGPHSLFIDTMRTIRIMGLAHRLGHSLRGENDSKISLLARSILHGLATAEHLVFDGRSGHAYDVRGRTAHEGVFNRTDGRFRCRSTQQGYSPFSTWTRGLAWAMLGFAEQLEFLKTLPAVEFARMARSADPEEAAVAGLAGAGGAVAKRSVKAAVLAVYEQAARGTCDHYVNQCAAADGMCYWDDGAPGLERLGEWRSVPADPFNPHEPVDSSAAAVAAQGLIRLGRYLGASGGRPYVQAGLTVARTLFDAPYLSASSGHQGLLLHSVYHRPNGWDHVPRGQKVPCGESGMWGDYHLIELAVLIQRLAGRRPYPTFFG